ncbi:MAG: 6-carboxytetrahydropterin synthase [Candidatus Latescibacteria bacterium]|nr:6-carboxytetrahydropterin synthase [Candidatus Latescibacterota bacterium]
MGLIQAVRRIQFCAGHRVLGHEGKCAFMHGHNYVALLHARAPSLDSVGRVIDFSVLKERLGGWIEDQWDHGFIHKDDDDQVARALESVPGQKRFTMEANPTAENMAAYLLYQVGPAELEGTGVELVKVELWETENCLAVVEKEAG